MAALYCADGEGWYYTINDFDSLITELKNHGDALKALYQDTKLTYEISASMKALLDKGVIEGVDQESNDAFAILPDVEASVAKFREIVVAEYGEEEATLLDDFVKNAIEKAN